MGSAAAAQRTPARNARGTTPATKVAAAELREDVIRLETPGSGGFSRPQERKADRIERDLAEGFVTRVGLRKAQVGK